MENKIIAVDFDGTLCVNKYPEIGEPRYSVIKRLKAEQEAGAKIILWTCRREKQLAEAVYWCSVQGLKFDAINENLKSTTERFGDDTRKVSATEYWDDRAVPISEELEAAAQMSKARFATEFLEALKDREGELREKAAADLSAAVRLAELTEVIRYFILLMKDHGLDASERYEK